MVAKVPFFVFLLYLSNNDNLDTPQMFTLNLTWNRCLSLCSTRPLWSMKLLTAPLGCCLLCKISFSNVGCMHTCCLIPKPKTTVVGLRKVLVHIGNFALTSTRLGCHGLLPARSLFLWERCRDVALYICLHFISSLLCLHTF